MLSVEPPHATQLFVQLREEELQAPKSKIDPIPPLYKFQCIAYHLAEPTFRNLSGNPSRHPSDGKCLT